MSTLELLSLLIQNVARVLDLLVNLVGMLLLLRCRRRRLMVGRQLQVSRDMLASHVLREFFGLIGATSTVSGPGASGAVGPSATAPGWSPEADSLGRSGSLLSPYVVVVVLLDEVEVEPITPGALVATSIPEYFVRISSQHHEFWQEIPVA